MVLVAGFIVTIAVGALVLMLPVSSRNGTWTEPIVALFIATSAVCVTGLVVVDTATYWSGFGQAVILVLVQLGGFGFMTGSTLLLLLLVRRRTTLHDRIVVQESLGARQLGGVTHLIARIAIFALVAEGIGAAILIGAQLIRGGPQLDDVWWGLFHAVSAFNNAGFDVVGGFSSLTGYAADWVVVGTIGTLVALGGLGYAVVSDAWAKRSWSRLALESKLVLLTSATLLVAGAVVIGVLEWNNSETLGRLAPAERALNATFHSVTARTAGFNTLPMEAMTDATLVLTMGLMFIGGASGSTAGGIKVNTFAVLGVAIMASIRGLPSAAIFGRRIPHATVYRGLAVALLAIATVFAVTLVLQGDSRTGFLATAFETISAFGTVGLSTGITPQLGDGSRLLLIMTMFVGRLGPLTLVLALAARARPIPYRPAVESVRIG
jgi:trk system potassium uptake protein TrkH